MRRSSDKSLRSRGDFFSPTKNPSVRKDKYTRFLDGFPDSSPTQFAWRLRPFRGNLRELIENRTSHGFSGQIKCASLGSTRVSDNAGIQVAARCPLSYSSEGRTGFGCRPSSSGSSSRFGRYSIGIWPVLFASLLAVCSLSFRRSCLNGSSTGSFLKSAWDCCCSRWL